jgi:hypothetical protein
MPVRTRIRWISTCICAVAMLFFTTIPSQAGFQVTFKVGGLETTIVDNVGSDVDGTAGVINVNSLTIGSYTFRGTIAETGTLGGLSFLGSDTFSVEGSGATTIQIIASANNFATPTGVLEAVSNATMLFRPGSKSGNQADISYSAYLDSTNNLATSGSGALIGHGGGVTITAGSGAIGLSDQRFPTNNVQPYTLTLQLQATFLNGGTNRLDVDGSVMVNALPIPATAALALTGIPLLALFGWKQRRKTDGTPLIA